MHVSCIQAGTFLARLRRPEYQHCVEGLEQYSYAYEECAEQALDIKRIYAQALVGDIELSHMASVFPSASAAAGQHAGTGGMYPEQPGVGVGVGLPSLGAVNGQGHTPMHGVEQAMYAGSYQG